MKLTDFSIDSNDDTLFVKFEAENPKDSAVLMEAMNRMPKSVRSLGKVDATTVWAWLSIPIKKKTYNENYFGNAK